MSAPCPDAGGSPGAAPDLVSARGQIVELGTSGMWTLRFADPLEVPDRAGTPFRVDLVLRDPTCQPWFASPTTARLNRMLRYDAVRGPGPWSILLIPKRAQNCSFPPTIDGDTMTIQVPGRILSADEDETGTSPGIGAAARGASSCATRAHATSWAVADRVNR